MDFIDEGIDLARDRNEYLLELIDTMEKGGFSEARDGGVGGMPMILGGGGLLGGLAGKGKGALGWLLNKGTNAGGSIWETITGGGGGLLSRVLSPFGSGVMPGIFEGASDAWEDFTGENPLDGLFDSLTGGEGQSFGPAMISAPEWATNLGSDLAKDLQGLSWPELPDIGGFWSESMKGIDWPSLPGLTSWWSEKTKGIDWPSLPGLTSWWTENTKGIDWPNLPNLGGWWKGATNGLDWPGFPDLSGWWEKTVNGLSWPKIQKPVWVDEILSDPGGSAKDAGNAAVKGIQETGKSAIDWYLSNHPLFSRLDSDADGYTPPTATEDGDVRNIGAVTDTRGDNPFAVENIEMTSDDDTETEERTMQTTRSEQTEATLTLESNTEYTIDDDAIVRKLKRHQREEVKEIERRVRDLERALKRV
ncbi:hypothetical protein [Halomarina rubra]|uniref:Uncharacterized protein n=1 Tax=Halomarina rubra TaxID=2071873 RepID=A0ABD6ARZ7_9EURY|nr:hypothetical protein [Halomarina rubra]